MSAGLCALFLRLPQLPSVGANAASNWATGRVGRGVGWAQLQWPEMDRSLRSLKTPGGGMVERTAFLGLGNGGSSLAAWSPSLRFGSFHVPRPRADFLFPARLGWALAPVFFLSEKARIGSHCPLLLKGLTNKDHWAWGGQGLCLGP